jgi:SH3-like domain-containing protein
VFQSPTDAGRREKRALGVLPVLAMAGLALMCAAASEATATMPGGDRPTPSHHPVPRWLTLKSDKVRARMGPGSDYRILWEYHARGLPVQVIAETHEWRKVCDPDGAVAWLHRSVVSPRRSAFNTSNQETPIHTGRSATSAIRARLSPRSIVSLDDCEEGWCHVGGRRVHGWIQASAVFGAQTAPLCEAGRPAGPRP